MDKLKYVIVAFVVLALLPSCNTNDPGKNTEKMENHPKVEDGKWKVLFDGTSSDAWRGFGKDSLQEGWIIEEGSLVASGIGGDAGGDIVTKEQYEDFELKLEWAIADGGNSGIFFRVLEKDYPTVYATGPEYQLIDDEGYPGTLEEWQKTAANYAMHKAKNKALKPAGEFNTSRIIVKGKHVEHWLNGNLSLEYDLWTEDWKKRVNNSKWKDYPGYGLALKGHIGLQDHGSKVYFRNIMIRDLTNKGKKIFNGNDLSGWKVHGTEKWYVEEGDLICESGPDKAYGYLSTKKEYKDFILRIKFKQESNGNSGVFIRSALDGTKISGWQIEVAPKGKDTGGIYESYGRGWLLQIPEEKENILKENKWNDLVIWVEGDRVLTWLNNEMMADLRDQKIGKATGVIALQIHDGGDVKVRWKDIFLRELK